MAEASNKFVEMPPMSEYGAKELKIFIKKSTYRAFGITCAILTVLFLAYFGAAKAKEASKKPPMLAPISKVTLEKLPPPSDDQADAPPPPPAQTVVNTGPAARAGNPVPVPDAEISADLQDFATVDVMSRASAEGGDGLDLGGFAANIDFEGSGKEIKIEQKEEEPGIDEFIPVEKEPAVDLGKLQKLVEYPDMARKAGIEGRVIVRVLVDKDGSVRRQQVEYSDNEMLNESALNAIKEYGRFTPAIQNQEPVMCWVSIPIQFRLR